MGPCLSGNGVLDGILGDVGYPSVPDLLVLVQLDHVEPLVPWHVAALADVRYTGGLDHIVLGQLVRVGHLVHGQVERY